MVKRRRRVGVAALALLLGVTTAAIATVGGGPNVDQAEASIVFTDGVIWTRTCEGRDGDYADDRVRARGTATGDPRLSGKVILRITRNLVELETGDGFQIGTLEIRDPNTNELKARARIPGDGGVAEIFQGSLVGRVVGHGKFFANWRTTFHENGAVTAQIGGEAPDGRLATVVARGECKGPFQRFEFTLPAPDANGAARRASPRAYGWAKR
jgi:hypothetical protein